MTDEFKDFLNIKYGNPEDRKLTEYKRTLSKSMFFLLGQRATITSRCNLLKDMLQAGDFIYTDTDSIKSTSE